MFKIPPYIFDRRTAECIEEINADIRAFDGNATVKPITTDDEARVAQHVLFESYKGEGITISDDGSKYICVAYATQAEREEAEANDEPLDQYYEDEHVIELTYNFIDSVIMLNDKLQKMEDEKDPELDYFWQIFLELAPIFLDTPE